jgi:sugar phosphate isomerase/epimerase
MKISRRAFGFLSASSALGLVLPQSRANEPIQRSGRARLKLSLAAYGFRDFFKDTNNAKAKPIPDGQAIDMFQFIDYCAEHDCAAEVTSYYFPTNANADYFLKLKRHAFIRGVELSGTAVGNTFTNADGEKRRKQIEHVNAWIDNAALLGVPHIRVFAGSADGQSLEVAKKNCILALEECCAYAAKKGVFLGIENHGGIVAEPEDLLEIVRTVKSPWLGINLDTANFHTDDPYRDLARCAPYAVNVQVKTEIAPRGQKKSEADLKRFVQIFKDVKYQGYLVLEYEAAEDPHSAIPRALDQLRALI